MGRIIIIVSKKRFPLDKIHQFFLEEDGIDYTIRLVDNYGAAQAYMLDPDNPVVLYVADFSIEGAQEEITLFKDDEVFRFLPVLAIIPKMSPNFMRMLLSCGCESYIVEEQLSQFMIEYMSIILYRYEHMNENTHMLSKLQEKAIKDFILLDIIKNYIPRKIWFLAESFAEKQQFSIPEEEVELSICFADICNFSTLSQYRKPKEVVNMLNTIFEVATRYVFYYSGDIDKFIGDAFLALFADSKTAVIAMYGIQKELLSLNDLRAARGEPILQFRIGIHSGMTIRGNVGGNERYDNTLIGDAVNTASRLEAKAPDGGLVISDSIRKDLNLEIPAEYLLSSKLKGRAGTEIYWSIFDYLAANPELLAGLEFIDEVSRLKGQRIENLHKNLTR